MDDVEEIDLCVIEGGKVDIKFGVVDVGYGVCFEGSW